MKRSLAFVLVMCMLLTGCAARKGSYYAPATLPQPTEPAATEPSAAPPTQPVTVPTTEPATEPTTAPTEPPLLYQNPLTGEAMETPYTGRPVAVVINNISSAMPQHGISDAAFLCECMVEGGLTRCLAIFDDIESAAGIGAIRSARTYFLSLAMSFNAPLVHFGSSKFFDQMYEEQQWQRINGMSGTYGKFFYRNPERLAAGYAKEHTVFTSGAKLKEALEKKKIPLTTENQTYSWQFSEHVSLGGGSAQEVEVTFRSRKTTSFTYQPDTGLYAAFQHGKDYIDGNHGGVLDFRNILVLFANISYSTTSTHVFAQLTGTGTGYLAVNGEYVPICWSRATERDGFVLTLEDGTPVTLGVGSTYLAVSPSGSRISFS